MPRLRLIVPLLPLFFLHAYPAPDTPWPVYRGGPEAIQHSELAQIHPGNVAELEPAWTFRTGDGGERTTIQCNPIVIGRRMYITSPRLAVICLDAATGEERWRYVPSARNSISGVNRGVTWWGDPREERILFTAGHHLIALDAWTGKPIPTFGERGKVDLRQHLGYPAESLSIVATSPGIVFNDLIIMGSATGEGYNASPGHIRAYDVRTGELAWIFHTIPQPGQPGHETWDWWEGEWYGGTNVWGGLSLDPERGWVFLATGSPTYDFYAANRKGINLYGNSVVALDAATGDYIWHYQVVHHDLWDYDLPCAPSLATITVDGVPRDAVIQPTKMGFLVVLDRETGEPIFPIDERPMPPSDIPGEQAWPTQPIPRTGFFTRQTLHENDLRTFSTGTDDDPVAEYRRYRYWGRYTPPSLEGSIAMPGTWGGGLWGGASVDPAAQTMFISANELASINMLRPVAMNEQVGSLDDRPRDDGPDPLLGRRLYAMNCTACHGADRQGIPPSYPTLIDIQDRRTHDEIVSFLQNGNGAMPAFPQFNAFERDSIIQFLYQADELPPVQPPGEGERARYITAGYFKFLDKKGYPLSAPPWGSLNAIDLTTGKLKWKMPLGEIEELTRMGIPPTGDRNFGGCISTASGLVFIAASTDEKIRAFSSRSGQILWEAPLPAAGFATPATYAVDGRQFVVIAAGGGGRGGTPSSDTFVAFALPEAD